MTGAGDEKLLSSATGAVNFAHGRSDRLVLGFTMRISGCTGGGSEYMSKSALVQVKHILHFRDYRLDPKLDNYFTILTANTDKLLRQSRATNQ